MNQRRVRILVLGTGSIGMRHLAILAEMPAVQRVAVPVREARAVELVQMGHDARETIEEGLALEPHGAIVATDTGRHASDAERILERCAVLVEKPLAASAAAARRVAEDARRLGRRAHVACCLRFDIGLAWVQARLGAIGAVRLADAECLSWLPAWRPGRDHRQGYAARAGEGGALLDLIHEVDYCTWLMGPVRRVAARLENRGALGLPAAVEETASLILEHEGGATTNLRLSYAVQPPSRRLRIWGERGRLEWDGLGRLATHHDASGAEVDAIAWTGPDAMYRAQAEAWVAALRGEPSPRLVEAEAGVAAVAVCEAARRSSEGGAWETVA